MQPVIAGAKLIPEHCPREPFNLHNAHFGGHSGADAASLSCFSQHTDLCIAFLEGDGPAIVPQLMPRLGPHEHQTACFLILLASLEELSLISSLHPKRSTRQAARQQQLQTGPLTIHS